MKQNKDKLNGRKQKDKIPHIHSNKLCSQNERGRNSCYSVMKTKKKDNKTRLDIERAKQAIRNFYTTYLFFLLFSFYSHEIFVHCNGTKGWNEANTLLCITVVSANGSEDISETLCQKPNKIRKQRNDKNILRTTTITKMKT